MLTMLARTENIKIEGAVGPVDCVVEFPAEPPRGWALVLHPHPLHGGARENKVVTTISRACVERGFVALRPNFRGVGESAGEFDHARGETLDMLQVVEHFSAMYPEAAEGKWVLAGFSFGTSVAAQLYSQLKEDGQTLPDALMLIGSAVNRFKFRHIDVPDHTFMVHGEADEVVPLAEAMDFARSHALPVVVLPDASHFFHGKLIGLKKLLLQRLAGV
jgi:alpha/beta superfamily hydrolase